jgi:hypothetical protein
MEKEEVKLFTDIFQDKSFPKLKWRSRLLNYCRYNRYKIYAYSLLVGCAIVFFRNELILLYDLLK